MLRSEAIRDLTEMSSIQGDDDIYTLFAAKRRLILKHCMALYPLDTRSTLLDSF